MNIWKEPKKEDIPPSLQDFLINLGGPTAIHLPGESSKQTRAVVTLTHGNEPSGVEAVHEWLLTGKTPRVNIVIILSSVKTALMSPLFYYRHLPDERDLNRCFSPPYHDKQGQLALAILKHLEKSKAESLVDMHNTTGKSGSFAVSFDCDKKTQILASHFVNHLIISSITLGSLMEQKLGIPSITVESGGYQDTSSILVAKKGLQNYFLMDDLFSKEPSITLLDNPLRLELTSPCRIGYGDQPMEDKDITIRKNIQSVHFSVMEKGDELGWVKNGLNHFQIHGNRGHDKVENFFKEENGSLRIKRKMCLFMATSRPDIAVSDCLFYFICQDD